VKIRDIELIKLRCERPGGVSTPIASFVTAGAVFLKVSTDEGIDGFGEPSPYSASINKIQDLLEGSFKERWVGVDPIGLEDYRRPCWIFGEK